ncbi:hypothetical protein DRQ33_01135 [bacterium]|nr:MAG: hypothetical protein DRQ33_01135 [bacterium]
MKQNSRRLSERIGFIPDELADRISNCGEISWQNFGKRIVFYLPGMFTLYGNTGKYPAVSVTGSHCELQCKHCRGKLLQPMLSAKTPQELSELAKKLKAQGVYGILLSGGSTKAGEVPLEPLLPVVPQLKKMGLFVSAHTGFATKQMAERLAQSGIDQVLIDVVGDDRTMREILNLSQGVKLVHRSLDALFSAGLKVIPHIIIGLRNKISGEYNSLNILSNYPVELLVYVVSMPAVAMKNHHPIPISDVIQVITTGREKFPRVEQALGCARPRGEYRYHLEKWAIRAGINRMALWSENSVEQAKKLGLEISYNWTCCSVD